VDPKAAAAKRAAAAKKAVATKAAARKAAASASAAAGLSLLPPAPPAPQYDDDSGFPTDQGLGGGSAGASDAAAASKKRRPAGSPSSSASLSAAHQALQGAGRKSIRKATMDSSIETSRREALDQSRRASAKPKPKVEFRQWSQEELLAESVFTERENAKSLEMMLRIEEEKKKEQAPKAKQLGPSVRVQSRRNAQGLAERLVAFSHGFPDYLVLEQPQRTCPSTPLPSLPHALARWADAGAAGALQDRVIFIAVPSPFFAAEAAPAHAPFLKSVFPLFCL